MLKITNSEQKFHEVRHLQALEGNPLDAQQVAMFEMFEREGWSEEQRLDYIRERARKAVSASTIE